MTQHDECKTVTDLGCGYKKIKVYLVYDIKYDTRHDSRCVADGNITEVPTDSVYSGVMILCVFRMMIFLAELNDIDT